MIAKMFDEEAVEMRVKLAIGSTTWPQCNMRDLPQVYPQANFIQVRDIKNMVSGARDRYCS